MGINFGNNSAVGKIIGNLNRNTEGLRTVFERLSSGTRINRPSDDAAGLAVAQQLTVDAKISSRAKLNINDGISVAQVADGALDSITSMVTRMGELATQAANGTLSTAQRKALDSEFNALDQEIRRIMEQTTFNGVQLLTGQVSNNSVEQITSTTGGSGSNSEFAVSSDGQFVTYYDPSDGWLKQLDTVNNTTLLITDQIQSTSQMATSNGGQVVVFESTSNITGENSSGYNQLYTYNKSSGQFTQISNAYNSGDPFDTFAISADGSTVAFSSSTVYTDGGTKANAIGFSARPSLVVANLTTSTYDFYAMNGLPGTLSGISVSADGSYVGFMSNKNINGGNVDVNSEIWAVQVNNASNTINQITNTSSGGTKSQVSITNSGNIYFIATDNLSGLNPNSYANIFEYKLSSGSLSMLSDNQSGDNAVQLAVSSDGSYLTFLGRMDPDGNPQAGGLDLWNYDFLTGEWSQQTDLSSFPSVGNYKIAADGGSLFFTSNQDFTGNNADGSVELFKIDTSPDPYKLNIETGTGTIGVITAQLNALKSAIKGLGQHTLTSQSGSKAAIDWADTSLDQLSDLRGILGSAVARFEVANRVTESITLELEAANARIRDIDVATETANMLRYQILQDSSSALLAQANQEPSIALNLLQEATQVGSL